MKKQAEDTDRSDMISCSLGLYPQLSTFNYRTAWGGTEALLTVAVQLSVQTIFVSVFIALFEQCLKMFMPLGEV